ncbi:MAG: radical SAM protein [Candidatus Omnitrophica bacterium]|nr:radical SAM protein [Candidatus Omnitrophota bacterium]
MAKVSLIFYTYQLNTVGITSLSAYLKARGHQAQIIYMLSPYDRFLDIFPDSVYEQVMDACSDSDLIGLSVTSNYHLEAAKATKKIRKLGKPIVWGGVHPSLFPEGCIKEADIISRGESEEALLELMERVSRGEDYSDIKNLWVRTHDGNGNEAIKENPLRPLLKDLDSLPYPDNDFQSHLIVEEGALKRITPELMKKYMTSGNTWGGRIDYYVATSRGCPYRCAYCCNNGLQQLYGGISSRRKSAENVIREIEAVLKRHPFINYIFLSDEDLFAQPLDFIKQFAGLYKSRINLPFKIEFTPSAFNEDKFKLLVDAGAVECLIGVQTACDRTNRDMYQRHMKIEKVYEVLEVIRSYKDKVRSCFVHLIVCNEMEPASSTRETLDFVHRIDPFFNIRFFPLVHFPGTALYEMARKAGLIKEDTYLRYLAGAGLNQLEEIHRADYYTVCSMIIYFMKRSHSLRRFHNAFYRFFTNRLVVFIGRRRVFTRLLASSYLFMQRLTRLKAPVPTE